jgi:hypothetical protein
VATPEESMFINTAINKQIDMKKEFEIEKVKQVLTVDDDDWFYVLANKYKREVGIFLFKFKFDASREPVFEFLFTWRVQLEIGDASIYIYEGDNKEFHYKEMILSYKTAFNNTFNVLVLDMSKEDCENRVIFRHESF